MASDSCKESKKNKKKIRANNKTEQQQKKNVKIKHGS
jgi:hypothetical protein